VSVRGLVTQVRDKMNACSHFAPGVSLPSNPSLDPACLEPIINGGKIGCALLLGKSGEFLGICGIKVGDVGVALDQWSTSLS
jgi:hypothetical protein